MNEGEQGNAQQASEDGLRNFITAVLGTPAAELPRGEQSCVIPAPADGEVIGFEGQDGNVNLLLADGDGVDHFRWDADTALRVFRALGNTLEQMGYLEG